MAKLTCHLLIEPEFNYSGQVAKIRATRVTSRFPAGEAAPGSVVVPIRLTIPDEAFVAPVLEVVVPPDVANAFRVEVPV